MRLFTLLFALALAPAAHAGVALGLAGGAAVPLAEEPAAHGLGLGGRIGYAIDLNLFELTPELGVAWYGRTLPQLGGRVLFGKQTRPGVYGHLLLPLDGDLKPQAGFDAGALLDFGEARSVDFGVHAGAVSLTPGDPVEDLAFVAGAHLTLRL